MAKHHIKRAVTIYSWQHQVAATTGIRAYYMREGIAGDLRNEQPKKEIRFFKFHEMELEA